MIEEPNVVETDGFNGLANLGNTCYLNSCIQIILRMNNLNILLKNNSCMKYLKNKPESIFFVEWNKFRELMYSHTNCVIAPNAFVHTVHKVAKSLNREFFTGFVQNDMPEFLHFFIECMHNAISREVQMEVQGNVLNSIDKVAKIGFTTIKNIYQKDYSEMIQLFYCMNTMVLYDMKCPNDEILHNALSIKCEPIFTIDVSIPMNQTNITLFNCMDEYCREELLDGPNMWYNEKRNVLQTVKKRMMFWSLPNYMIITIKRFNNQLKKLGVHVDIPLKNVNFEKYVCGYNKSSYVYDLFGVCLHQGNVNSGHYFCNVLGDDGQWRQINDTSMRVIQENEVINANAYCIFYKKIK